MTTATMLPPQPTAVATTVAATSIDLPAGWKQEWSAQYNTPYFVNKYTNESIWVKPSMAAQPVPNPAMYTPPVSSHSSLPPLPPMAIVSQPAVATTAHHHVAVMPSQQLVPPQHSQRVPQAPLQPQMVPQHIVSNVPLVHPQPHLGQLQPQQQTISPVPQAAPMPQVQQSLLSAPHGYPTPGPSPISSMNAQVGALPQQNMQYFPPPPKATQSPNTNVGSQQLIPPAMQPPRPGSAHSYFNPAPLTQTGQGHAAADGDRGLGRLLGGISNKLTGTARPGKPVKQGSSGMAGSALGVGGAVLGSLLGGKRHGHTRPAHHAVPAGYVQRPVQGPVRPGAAAGGGGLVGAVAGLAMAGRRRHHPQQRPVYHQQPKPVYYYQQGQPGVYQQAYYDQNGTVYYADNTTYVADGTYVDNTTYVTDTTVVENNTYVSDQTFAENSTYVDGQTYADSTVVEETAYAEEEVYAEEQYVQEECVAEEIYDYQVEESYDAGGGWDCGEEW